MPADKAFACYLQPFPSQVMDLLVFSQWSGFTVVSLPHPVSSPFFP